MRSMNTRLFYKKNRKVVLGATVILLIFVLMVFGYWLAFIQFKTESTAWINKKFGDEYGTSIPPSMLEDIYFFGVLGFAVTIISIVVSTTKPEDNSFEIRLRSLANSRNVRIDDELYIFLKSKSLNFLAYNKSIIVNVEIRDFDSDNNAYLLFSDIEFTLTNMCSDIDYEDNEATMSLNPDVAIKGDNGTLVYLGYDNKPIAQMVQLTSLQYTQKFPLKIEKNSEVLWRFKHLLWSKTDTVNTDSLKWSFFESYRYTNSMVFNIKNCLSSKKSIRFDLKLDQKGRETPLANGKNIDFNSTRPEKFQIPDRLYPGDKVKFFIYA